MSSEQRSVKSLSRHRHTPSHCTHTLAAHRKVQGGHERYMASSLQQPSVLKSINKSHTCLICPDMAPFWTADNFSTISLVHTFNFDLRIHVKRWEHSLCYSVAFTTSPGHFDRPAFFCLGALLPGFATDPPSFSTDSSGLP